jgi:translation elongation factor EF-4
MKKVWSKNKEIVLTVYDDTVEEDWVMLRDRSKRLAQGVFLVCSYDDRNGILEFPTFIDQLARVKDVDYHCLSIVILINKCDLEVTSKQFTIEEVRKIADSYKIKHVIEVSALTGQGTEEACVKLAGVVTDLFSKEPRFVGLLEAGKELHTISCWDPKYKSLDRKRRCIVA